MQVLENVYIPLLQQHSEAESKGSTNGGHPAVYTRVLGCCRSFLSAVKRAEQRLQGTRIQQCQTDIERLFYHLLRSIKFTACGVVQMTALVQEACRTTAELTVCSLADDASLPMPELPPQSGVGDPPEEAITRLEAAMAEWVSAIQAALAQEAERTITGNGIFLSAADTVLRSKSKDRCCGAVQLPLRELSQCVMPRFRASG